MKFMMRKLRIFQLLDSWSTLTSFKKKVKIKEIKVLQLMKMESQLDHHQYLLIHSLMLIPIMKTQCLNQKGLIKFRNLH